MAQGNNLRSLRVEELDTWTRTKLEFIGTLKTMKNKNALDTQIAFRADQLLIDALDKEVARLKAERPGAVVKRSDVVRELCWRALQETSQ